MKFLVAYIVCGMSSLFLTIYVGNELLEYAAYAHVVFLFSYSFLTGVLLMLSIDKYLEVTEEIDDEWKWYGVNTL